MKKTRISFYDPSLSVEENAARNAVNVAAMRHYIKVNGIDRRAEQQRALYDRVRDYMRAHPTANAASAARELGLSAATVRKYLRMDSAPAPHKAAAIAGEKRVRFLSVSNSETDILKSILAIHLPGRATFDCDLTAWKCGFYRDGIARPAWLYDKYPQLPEVRPLDEIANDSLLGALKSLVVDLPANVRQPTAKKINVATMFSSMDELYAEHSKMLGLAHRLLRSDGILVYKTMDFTYHDTPMWLSDYVLATARSLGFELADKYICIDPAHAKIDRRRTKYTSSIPTHAYFFVFKKSGN